MKIAFRVDSSIQIGSGHVIRCLTLADRLREDGAQCHFFCRNLEGNLNGLISKRGFKVYVLDEKEIAQFKISENFTSGDWKLDTRKTLEFINADHFDWIIVDHYGLDSRWESVLRVKCDHLMVIDDIANRPHDCDILVDQNYDDALRYRNLVNKRSVLLLGPNYALIRPEYAHYRELRPQRKNLTEVRKVLVFFGGSDFYDLTGKALEALTFFKLIELNVDIVVGDNYPYYDKLKCAADKRGRTSIYKTRTHLADLMAASDIAIGGGGATNWERMCIGLPSIIITLADNQVPICEILSRKGAIRLLGNSKIVNTQDIYKAFLEEINSNTIFNRTSVALALCDGMGTDRVINKMKSIHQIH